MLMVLFFCVENVLYIWGFFSILGQLVFFRFCVFFGVLFIMLLRMLLYRFIDMLRIYILRKRGFIETSLMVTADMFFRWVGRRVIWLRLFRFYRMYVQFWELFIRRLKVIDVVRYVIVWVCLYKVQGQEIDLQVMRRTFNLVIWRDILFFFFVGFQVRKQEFRVIQ